MHIDIGIVPMYCLDGVDILLKEEIWDVKNTL